LKKVKLPLNARGAFGPYWSLLNNSGVAAAAPNVIAQMVHNSTIQTFSVVSGYSL